ncbi:MAG: hypothetical protein M1493_11815 [Firmicutes bacterium]|nr:hypothetical protein [Bacillota bacterium]
MNWRGAIIRFVTVWVLMEIFRHTFTLTQFPGISWLDGAILAVVCAVIGYLADEMFGGYLSAPGRGFVGFIVTTAVLVIYFTRYVNAMHTFYVFDAIVIGAIVGLADAGVGNYLRNKGRQTDQE